MFLLHYYLIRFVVQIVKMGLNLQSLISPHFFNILYYIKRKQSDYKPGSVRTISQFSTDEACLSFIYSMSHPMAQAFYPPPNNRAGYPGGGGLHELAAPKMHSRHVTVPLVSSYLTFSPFLLEGSCCFLLHYSTLADCFYIRKWDALCCPDFPLVALSNHQRQTVRLLSGCKGTIK